MQNGVNRKNSMSETKDKVPSLFGKSDLLQVSLVIFLILLVIVVSRDSVEIKALHACAILLGFASLKGLSVIFQVYYPSSKEKPLSFSSIIQTLLSVLVIGILTGILTWEQGGGLKEHIYSCAIVVGVIFVVVVITKNIFKDKR